MFSLIRIKTRRNLTTGKSGLKEVPLNIIILFWDYTVIGYIMKTNMSKSIYSKEYEKIIERLRKARIEEGLTQQQVANKLGKPQSYVSKIESGERRLDVVEIKKFAKIYEKQTNYFLK